MSARAALAFVLLLLLQIAGLSAGQSANATNTADVAGLQSLKASATGLPPSWYGPEADPCGAADCDGAAAGARPCNWRGLRCEAWRVTAIMLQACTFPDCRTPGQCACSDALPPGSKVVGTLPPGLAQLSELRDLGLRGNAFTGALPPEWGALGALATLDVGRNQLTGGLPTAYSRLHSLSRLTLGGNLLGGVLPGSYGNMTALADLDLSENSLTGALPSSWGALGQLKTLNLELNDLSGPLPYEWAQQSALSQLNVRSNCAICGNLPPYPQLYSRSLTIYAGGSSLGWACSSGNCASSFPLGFVGQGVIVAVVVVLLGVTCCWRRACVVRRARRRGQPADARGWALARGMLLGGGGGGGGGQGGGARRDARASVANLGDLEEAKVDPPILVLNPCGGQALCIARLDPDTAAAAEGEEELPGGRAGSPKPAGSPPASGSGLAEQQQMQQLPGSPGPAVSEGPPGDLERGSRQGDVPGVPLAGVPPAGAHPAEVQLASLVGWASRSRAGAADPRRLAPMFSFQMPCPEAPCGTSPAAPSGEVAPPEEAAMQEAAEQPR